MCMCMICKTEHEEDFTLYRQTMLCDDCMSILEYHYKNAKYELEDRHMEVNNSEMWESELLEGLEEYLEIKAREYREER